MQTVFSMAVLLALLAVVSCTVAASDYSPEDIIALERGALDRWGKGDPEGFLELMSEDETYFDPMTEKQSTVAKRCENISRRSLARSGSSALKSWIQRFSGSVTWPC